MPDPTLTLSYADAPERAVRGRVCHYCGLSIPDDEPGIQARTGNAWAHFECWYDGPIPAWRDPETGALLLARHTTPTGGEQ